MDWMCTSKGLTTPVFVHLLVVPNLKVMQYIYAKVIALTLAITQSCS